MAVKNVTSVNTTDEEQTLNDNMKMLKNFRFQHIVDINMVRVFIIVWLAATVLALIPVLRPCYSETEKRELKKFPEFSFKALASGSYFDDISLWFSDTFPMRDGFVALNTNIKNTFGINSVQVHGTVQQGDEIPDASAPQQSVDSTPDESVSVDTQPEPQPQPQLPVVEQLGAMLIIDDAAYEYYNFNQETADKYSATVSRAADMLSGKAHVYSMIVPTSMAITLPESYSGSTNSSDQKKAIDYMYSVMSPNVYTVDAYTPLINHKDEYIYFRTDHHWTALGAYYAYRELMSVRGTAAAELSAFTEYRFDGFLGSFYAESGQNAKLGGNPDYVMAYEPKQQQFIHTFLEGGGQTDYHIVSNGDDLSEANKYLTFVCGDHPYGIINNPTITDGSSCLVIKESFGNAMVAYLTQHYQNVYVVDYRYISKVFPGTLSQFVDERAIGDVVFVNNISATRSPALVTAISTFVG